MTPSKQSMILAVAGSLIALAAAFAWGCRAPIVFPSIKVPMPTTRPVDCPEPQPVRVAR